MSDSKNEALRTPSSPSQSPSPSHFAAGAAGHVPRHHGAVPPQAAGKVDRWRYPFWFGGSASCCAAMVTHPLDLIKVRLQNRGVNDPTGMLRTGVNIFREKGALALYNGLSASLLRQITYSTTRFGVYEFLKSSSLTTPFSTPASSSTPSFPDERRHSPTTLVALASISGFIGGIVGNPADVTNVRMQNDVALPHHQRRNYSSAFNGLYLTYRHEGVAGLFRGVAPNSARSIFMTTGQLASYDVFKAWVCGTLGLRDGLATHFLASLMAGFVATTICSPIDVVKTRVMSAHSAGMDASGGAGREILGVVQGLFREDGIRWMFRGWTPAFIRLGPHTIATFLFLEEHKKIYRAIMQEQH